MPHWLFFTWASVWNTCEYIYRLKRNQWIEWLLDTSIEMFWKTLVSSSFFVLLLWLLPALINSLEYEHYVHLTVINLFLSQVVCEIFGFGFDCNTFYIEELAYYYKTSRKDSNSHVCFQLILQNVQDERKHILHSLTLPWKSKSRVWPNHDRSGGAICRTVIWILKLCNVHFLHTFFSLLTLTAQNNTSVIFKGESFT